MDIWLMEDIPAIQLQQRILEAVPPGLEIQQVTIIARDTPKLQKVIQAAEYSVQLDPSSNTEQFQGKIDRLLDLSEISRTRRGKKYDLRPLIEALEMGYSEGDVMVRMRLSARDGATGRPEEVLIALDTDPSKATIHRSRLFLESK
jgi:radical SAM-linked protein